MRMGSPRLAMGLPKVRRRDFFVSRAMAVILPMDTIGQTWIPLGVALLREHFGSYGTPMAVVLGVAVVGATAVMMLPKERRMIA